MWGCSLFCVLRVLSIYNEGTAILNNRAFHPIKQSFTLTGNNNLT